MNGGAWVVAACASVAVHLGALAVGLALVPRGGETILYLDLTVAAPPPREAESRRPPPPAAPARARASAPARATPRRNEEAPRPDPVRDDHGAERRSGALRAPRPAETEAPEPVDDRSAPAPPAPPPESRVVTGATPSRAQGDAAPIDPAPASGARPEPGPTNEGLAGPSAAGTTGGDRSSSAAVTSGSGQAGDPDYARYYSLLSRRIREALEYPSGARRRHLSGTVELEIVVGPDGAVGDVTVVATSSHLVLDEAAVQAARSIHPLPFPAGLRPRTLRARLPVVFELR